MESYQEKVERERKENRAKALEVLNKVLRPALDAVAGELRAEDALGAGTAPGTFARASSIVGDVRGLEEGAEHPLGYFGADVTIDIRGPRVLCAYMDKGGARVEVPDVLAVVPVLHVTYKERAGRVYISAGRPRFYLDALGKELGAEIPERARRALADLPWGYPSSGPQGTEELPPLLPLPSVSVALDPGSSAVRRISRAFLNGTRGTGAKSNNPWLAALRAALWAQEGILRAVKRNDARADALSLILGRPVTEEEGAGRWKNGSRMETVEVFERWGDKGERLPGPSVSVRIPEYAGGEDVDLEVRDLTPEEARAIVETVRAMRKERAARGA